MITSTNLSKCITAFTDTEHISTVVVYIVSGLSILGILLNFTSNISVIYSLISTKQLNNPSMRMIFYLSCSDLCMAIFGQTTFITVITGTEATCDFKSLSEFFLQFFGHTSAYIIGLIGYDRYFRMKYLNRYSEFVSTCKLNIGLVIGTSIAFAQSLMVVMGTQYGVYVLMTVLYQSIDLVMFIIILLPYVLAVLTVRNHRKQAYNRELLKQVDQIITSTATRIMIAVVILFTPYVLFTFPRIILASDSPIRREAWFNACVIIGYLFTHSNSFVNGFIFLSYNVKCRERVVFMLKKIFSCCLIQDYDSERQAYSTDTELT